MRPRGAVAASPMGHHDCSAGVHGALASGKARPGEELPGVRASREAGSTQILSLAAPCPTPGHPGSGLPTQSTQEARGGGTGAHRPQPFAGAHTARGPVQEAVQALLSARARTLSSSLPPSGAQPGPRSRGGGHSMGQAGAAGPGALSALLWVAGWVSLTFGAAGHAALF